MSEPLTSERLAMHRETVETAMRLGRDVPRLLAADLLAELDRQAEEIERLRREGKHASA